jgi:hypothetical protein
MGKDNGVLRGAWTAALVKIQILPEQIFTMAEVFTAAPVKIGARAFPLKKREKRKKTKVTDITCFSTKEKRKSRVSASNAMLVWKFMLQSTGNKFGRLY